MECPTTYIENVKITDKTWFVDKEKKMTKFKQINASKILNSIDHNIK